MALTCLVLALVVMLSCSSSYRLCSPSLLAHKQQHIHILHKQHTNLATKPASVPSALLMHNGIHIHPDISKTVMSSILSTSLAARIGTYLPASIKTLAMAVHPSDALLTLFVYFTYRKILRFAHHVQVFFWEGFSIGTPYEYKKSILGFTEERTGLLVKLMGCNYIVKLVCAMLSKLGFRIPSDFPALLSGIAYTIYLAHFLDLFKGQFLKTFFPSIADSRRQNYVVNRSSSVVIWIITVLIACEMVSTFLKVPLSSTLAFGGVGGLAIGLSARDIAANFIGGMLLLFNEPFTPGDMVSFRTGSGSGSTELIGRVERIGWGQTRIRGKDTRPTYVPNSHFVQTAVTNMERITHRKFEASVRIRLQDYEVMPEVIERIKELLRALPKLDMLSMPFRASFVKIGDYFLEIEVSCYFATKSIDEFLSLQQQANMEIIRAIVQSNAALALPTSVLQLDAPSIQPQPQQPTDLFSPFTGETMVVPESGLYP